MMGGAGSATRRSCSKSPSAAKAATAHSRGREPTESGPPKRSRASGDRAARRSCTRLLVTRPPLPHAPAWGRSIRNSASRVSEADGMKRLNRRGRSHRATHQFATAGRVGPRSSFPFSYRSFAYGTFTIDPPVRFDVAATSVSPNQGCPRPLFLLILPFPPRAILGGPGTRRVLRTGRRPVARGRVPSRVAIGRAGRTAEERLGNRR
jgi:hypothetical protein